MTTATATARTTGQASELAHRHGPWVARAGWIAKGAVYAVVGILTLQLALGDPSGSADQEGAVRAVAQQSFGTVLLVILIVGLVAYSIGRWLEASVLAEPEMSGLDRAKAIGSGIGYAALAVFAVRLVTESGGGGGGGAKSLTADAMEAPLGRWLVGLVGLAFIAAGIYEAWEGVTKKFMEDLDTSTMDQRVRRSTERAGQIGLVARGIAWSLVGWFVIAAAVQFDPSEAKGLDQALRSLADEAWGTVVLLVVALGFVAYGAYCVVQARYRDVGAS